MDEEEISTENIKVEDGGVTTTPEEVAELLHLDKPAKAPEKTEENEEESENETEEQKTAREAQEASDKVESDKVEADRISKEAEDKKPTEQTDTPKFDLEVEDANGVKFNLKPGDDLETVLKDFEPKSNGQIFAILEKLNDLKSEKAKYDAEQSTKAQEAEHSERLVKIQSGWDSEIKSLQGQKRLELDTNGKSERVDKVFDFMREENDKRIKDGRPLIQSFEDALDKMELRETKEEASKKAKEEKELARKKGSLVGGSSSPASSGAPVYKGGARNANEAARMLGLLK